MVDEESGPDENLEDPSNESDPLELEASDSEDEDRETPEAPKKKKKKKRSPKAPPEKALNPEEAALVNPKRASAMKKTTSLVEDLLHGAKLETDDHVLKAWKMLNEQVDTKKSKKYSLKADYTQNEVIKHTKFGVGFINQKLSPTKIEVIFEEGMRRLTCNR